MKHIERSMRKLDVGGAPSWRSLRVFGCSRHSPRAAANGQCARVLKAIDRAMLRVDTTYRSWADAQSHCVLLGGRLVSVHSATQNADVRAAVNAASLGDHVWLGGSDLASEGVWTWTDGGMFSNGGTAINGAYVNWCAIFTYRFQMPAVTLMGVHMLTLRRAQVGIAARQYEWQRALPRDAQQRPVLERREVQ